MSPSNDAAARWYPGVEELLGLPKRLVRFLDACFDGHAVYSEGALRHASDRLARIVGHTPESLEGQDLQVLLRPSSQEAAVRAVRAQDACIQADLDTPDGLPLLCELRFWAPEPGPADTRLVLVRLAHIPITGDLPLGSPDPGWTRRLDALDGAVFELDGESRIVRCALGGDGSARPGLALGDVVGGYLDLLLPVSLAQAGHLAIKRARAAGGSAQARARVETDQGSLRFDVDAHLDVRTNKGQRADGHAVLVLREVGARARLVGELDGARSDLAAAHSELHDLRNELAEARHRISRLTRDLDELGSLDRVTGLPNKRVCNEYLAREWRSALRAKVPLTLAVLDLDFFKPYEDVLGAAARDVVLSKISQCVQRELRRPRDFVGRIAEDRFALVLADTDLSGAADRAEAIRAAIVELDIENPCAPTTGRVSASIGMASTTPTPRAYLRDLIEAAEAQLRVAKQVGGNQVRSTELDLSDGT